MTPELQCLPVAPVWERVAAQQRPSWYLDPLVARQKREAHLALFREWMPPGAAIAAKTDVFEEAFGGDALLPGLAPLAGQWIGMDVATATVQQAQARFGEVAGFVAADTRELPLRSGCLDAIVSNSTLDHFATREEFEAAIGELARTLRPGGRLLITVDNPRNLLYVPLRWACSTRWAPYPLGYTPSLARLRGVLENAGLEVVASSSLIHNPRLISTAVFYLLRRVFKARADGPVQWLLDVFASLEKLPTWQTTACFVAACAVRRK